MYELLFVRLFFLEGGINLISLMQRADLENNAYVT